MRTGGSLPTAMAERIRPASRRLSWLMTRASAGALKVPEITLLFWVVKLLSTAMGEATSDYFVFQINPYVAVMLGCVGLAVALVLQLRSRRYGPWTYWFAVVMVAVFGTMAADVLHVELHIPYVATTIAFSAALAAVFVLWYSSERTLSIHTIYSGRRELFYWATVIATFALGTAAGDMTAATFHLGYLASLLVFAGLFLLPGIGYWRFGLNPIFGFWFAYVMTRPLGASFADWMGKPYLGGLGLGDGRIAGVLTVMIVVLVGYLAASPTKVGKQAAGSH